MSKMLGPESGEDNILPISPEKPIFSRANKPYGLKIMEALEDPRSIREIFSLNHGLIMDPCFSEDDRKEIILFTETEIEISSFSEDLQLKIQNVLNRRLQELEKNEDLYIQIYGRFEVEESYTDDDSEDKLYPISSYECTQLIPKVSKNFDTKAFLELKSSQSDILILRIIVQDLLNDIRGIKAFLSEIKK